MATTGDVAFGSNIDLGDNEVRNVKLHKLAAASPPTAAAGQIWYDTTNNVIKYHNGSGWVILWPQDTTALAGNGLTAVDADTIAASYGAITSGASFGQSNSNGTATTLARSDHTHALPAHDAAAHSAIKVSDLAAPTSDVAFNSRKITGLADGSAATDAATVGQVQAAASGLDVKQSVRAASTGDVTLTYNATAGASGRGQITGAPNTLDGVTLTNGNRVLLKDQSTGAQNGIWTVTTAGSGSNGTWDRATDFDADAEVTANAFVFVEEGTTNGDTGFVLTTNNPITIGGGSGTALTWAQFSGAGNIVGGAGLTKTGTTLDVGAGTGISVAADSVGIDTAVVALKYSASIGNNSATSFVVTHNLNTRDIVVSVREVGSPYAQVFVSSEATTVNTCTVYFAVAPTTDQYRVTVTG